MIKALKAEKELVTPEKKNKFISLINGVDIEWKGVYTISQVGRDLVFFQNDAGYTGQLPFESILLI